MADANSLEQRTMIDIPTGRCRIKSQGQFVKRVPSLAVLKRPTQHVAERPWLTMRPMPEQRTKLIQELEYKEWEERERQRREDRRAAQQEQRRRMLRRVRTSIPGHNFLRNRRNRQRNADSDLNGVSGPPSTAAGTNTSSSPRSRNVSPPKREKSDKRFQPADEGTFPTFNEDGSHPRYPEFNPHTTDYSEILGEYEVKAEEIPLEYFDSVDNPVQSKELVPTHVIETDSAYLFKFPDPETRVRHMHMIPAGHYCPSLRFMMEVSTTQVGKLPVGENGEEWEAYEIKFGYYLLLGKIFCLPSGTLITKTPLKEMTHLNKFVHVMNDERSNVNDIFNEFRGIAKKIVTDPGITPQYGLRSRNDVLKSVGVPEYFMPMQYHAQFFDEASTFCLIKGFFGWFKYWPSALAMGEIRTKDQIISAMELFIFLLEIELLGYYVGPSPPYSFLSNSDVSETVLARENAAILHHYSSHKKRVKGRSHGEPWSNPGGNRTRRPSTLAVSSGLDPDSISIDLRGSTLDLNVSQGNRPRWFDPRSPDNTRFISGPTYLPRGRTGSDSSWVTVNNFESDSDAGSVFGDDDDDDDKENTLPDTDLGSENFPNVLQRYDTQWSLPSLQSTTSLPGSGASSSRRGQIGSRVRQGVDRVRGSLSRLTQNRNRSASTSGYPSLGNYGLFK